jgi:hypothetical protein
MLTLKQLFGACDHDSVRRSYAVYRPENPDPCPACGGRQWLVGRVSAECASCATALPLIDAGKTGAGLIRGTVRGGDDRSLAA